MIDRIAFLRELEAYAAFDATEEEMRARMQRFVTEQERCFERALSMGHITASCWVLDPGRSRALLAFHKRLERWLQMGGHIEDDASLLEAAARELREESGLSRFRAASGRIFDLDVHLIPARKHESDHFHYDVRFLFEADPGEPLQVSAESREVAWVALDRIAELNGDASMTRMLVKGMVR
jgi:8-oxo-dGTP pyrophosphatase MutT (NUDIX family)